MSDKYIIRTTYFDENREVILTGDEEFDEFDTAHDYFSRLEDEHARNWTDEEVVVGAWLSDLYSFEYERAPGLVNKVWFIKPNEDGAE